MIRKLRGVAVKVFAVYAAVAFFCLLLPGCGKRAEKMDARDVSHPLMKKARIEKESGDLEAAIRLYEEALEDRPDLVRAHLELGLLYDNPQGDNCLRAIYHYERYLEKRPDTEKRDIVEGLILGAKLSYAATLSDQPSGAVRKIAALTKENILLKARLDELAGCSSTGVTEVSSGRVQGGTTSNTVLLTPEPAPSVPAVELYIVEKNDTLSRIAKKRYNDANKWNVLYEANRDRLKNPADLRLGQELIIPDLSE